MSEIQFKEDILELLSHQNDNWVDGDKDQARKNKADIVNHALKIAIEVKDEPKGGSNLLKAVEEYGDILRSVTKKFREYPQYKTALLIRGSEQTIAEIVYQSIKGVDRYERVGDTLIHAGVVNKYKGDKYLKKKIGCYLIFCGAQYYYFSNKLSSDDCVIKKEKIADVFGLNFE